MSNITVSGKGRVCHCVETLIWIMKNCKIRTKTNHTQKLPLVWGLGSRFLHSSAVETRLEIISMIVACMNEKWKTGEARKK